jgi:IS5 family transposase
MPDSKSAQSADQSMKRKNVFRPFVDPGLFDEDQQRASLTACGDPLVVLNKLIDWEIFRPRLVQLFKKRPGVKSLGRKPLDPVLMFKVLVLQRLYNLSDDQAEFQIRDRTSFQRFLGFYAASGSPDAKTIWLFRERLHEENIAGELFLVFDKVLEEHGMFARTGQMIDASFVEVPRQRNTREENEKIKAGEVPEDWKTQPNKLAQKDVDARWAKKHDEDHYGYKNHINADTESKLIRAYLVTPASLHDSQAFDDLLLPKIEGKTVYADSAYRSAAFDAFLKKALFVNRIIRKAHKNTPLTEQQKSWNHRWSKTRSRVEHIFGAMFQVTRGGAHLLYVGQKRATTAIGIANLVYNIQRSLQILRSRERVSAAPA